MRIALAACTVGAGLLPGLATAVQPNGPWITDKQNVSLEAFASNQQLYDQLSAMSRRFPMRCAGTGRQQQRGPSYLARRLGNADKPAVMIITQQHGNEPHGTEAAVNLIQRLASGGALSRRVLDNLQVLIVPRVNPDGAERFSRGNMDFSAPQTSADCLRDDGTLDPAKLDQRLGANVTAYTLADGQRRWSYDINRYHWTDWSASTQIRCNPGLAGERHFNPGRTRFLKR